VRQPIAIIGIGQMGGVFGRAFLKAGFPVYPVTRSVSLGEAARELPAPRAALVAVGEKALPGVLAALPSAWRAKCVLLQNELLPPDWQKHGVLDPTVISVWFEKKRGQGVKVLLPSPLYGPASATIAGALERLDIPCRLLKDEDELLRALVVKNLFVLTINIAGLETGGTVEALWSRHQTLVRRVADEVIGLQESLAGRKFARQRLLAGLTAGIEAAPLHRCRGRSAPERLERVIAAADAAGLPVPTLRGIHARQGG
jgi:hypothetical protein